MDTIDRLRPIMLSGLVVAEVKSPCDLKVHVHPQQRLRGHVTHTPTTRERYPTPHIAEVLTTEVTS